MVLRADNIKKALGTSFLGMGHADLLCTPRPECRGAPLVQKVKRVEPIIDPAALDRVTESAQALKLSEFDVTEVRSTRIGISVTANGCIVDTSRSSTS